MKKGNAPLFYSIERQRNPDRKNPTYTSVGNKLAEWVRELGIEDPKVAPNHGLRHRKTAGRSALDAYRDKDRDVRVAPTTRHRMIRGCGREPPPDAARRPPSV